MAILGAVAMVAGGAIPWDEAVAAVDVHTLALLFGMMIVAAYLRLSGFFAVVTAWTARRARTPDALLATIVVVSGVLSALFVNDIVCLVLAPLVVALIRQLRLPPLPYLIALATASNVGSVATLTGTASRTSPRCCCCDPSSRSSPSRAAPGSSSPWRRPSRET